ncbi:MAG: hypothetical protein ABS28_06360 [Cryomorphaceae bacterium BACL22 MAG-120619-bin32]|nr:MAG: hypothetical protein ABS28_06360 [Cryomorphaceae bacterium BACL22 MAG-120619-bin32]
MLTLALINTGRINVCANIGEIFRYNYIVIVFAFLVNKITDLKYLNKYAQTIVQFNLFLFICKCNV